MKDQNWNGEWRGKKRKRELANAEFLQRHSESNFKSNTCPSQSAVGYTEIMKYPRPKKDHAHHRLYIIYIDLFIYFKIFKLTRSCKYTTLQWKAQEKISDNADRTLQRKVTVQKWTVTVVTAHTKSLQSELFPILGIMNAIQTTK